MLQEEQGQDHRKAWLGKDLERSSGSEPPDTDQVTGPGKAVTGWTTNGLPEPWDSLGQGWDTEAVLGRGGAGDRNPRPGPGHPRGSGVKSLACLAYAGDETCQLFQYSTWQRSLTYVCV